ncbi:MAG: DUF5050 domain-containing protein, partial [Clostridia bacterium]|nr:DUF5050 domain-containing protein [Clostridia bacterium]
NVLDFNFFADCFHIVDDWVYYYQKSGLDCDLIRKVKIDGTQAQDLCCVTSNHFNVVGDWIYYCESINGKNGLHRIKTDGTGKQKLIEGDCFRFCATDEWVFYRLSGEYELKRMKSGGTEISLLSDDAANSINYSDGWVYYSCNNIYRIRVDGSDKQKLCDMENCSNINVAGDWMFFTSNESGTEKWYRMRTNGDDLKIMA